MLDITDVLNSHGITGTGDTLTDNARKAGLIYACLGCGSVGGIDPNAVEWRCNGSVVCDYMLDQHGRSCDRAHAERVEAARQATRDSIDVEEWCCGDATQVIF